jgi:lipopolysaccharide export system protein LptA
MSWQKPARIAVAVVGLASAAGVYFATGQRRVPPPSTPIHAEVPEAVVESSDCSLNSFLGVTKNFEVECHKLVRYEDGRTQLTGNPLRIRVRKDDGRTFTVTGTETWVSQDQNSFEVSGSPVRLEGNDGFWLETDRTTVSRLTQVSHVPGAATFGKGRMSGSGTGFSYDNNREILVIAKDVRVKTVDEGGKVVTDLTSATGMLDRLQHLLTLDTGVHVVREDQVIDTDHASGRLSPSNDIVTWIDLFGNSRVAGGASIDSMKARDITLDYTDDGKTLEASKLVGGASIAMKGEGEGPGRQMEGEAMDLTLAPDGMLTSAVVRPGPDPAHTVRLDLPPSADTPARSITARTLDGTGEPGKGLTRVVFTEGVLYLEALRSNAAASDKQTGMRTARSQRLEASLADDAVTEALFSGDTTFEEAGLKACAARADYDPRKGMLTLSGATKAGLPMAAQEQVAIEAAKIEVTLDTRNMTAVGTARDNVTTFMRSPRAQRCKPSTERPASQQGASSVPGLLKDDAPTTVSVTADSFTAAPPTLEYDSQNGRAVYTGRATLMQEGDTSIVADRLLIDQNKGDLKATGRAVTRLPIDGNVSEGRAHEVQYDDEKRLLTYLSQPKASAGEVSLKSGRESTLTAGNIAITLAAKENKADSMRARGNVRLSEEPNSVIGATLDYRASDERFVVTGDSGRPAVAASREGDQCRIMVGHEITFRKGSSNVAADGDRSRARTEPLKSGACTAATPSTLSRPSTPLAAPSKPPAR